MCNFCIAQTKFLATISPAQAGIDEYITLKLTVENGQDVKQINPPSLIDFNVLSGPNQETSMNSINGVVTQSISLSYILQPKKAGNFTIANSTAIIGNKTFKSNAVKIVVSNKKSSNKGNPTNSSPFAALDIFDEPKPKAAYEDYILRKGETVQDKVNKNMQLQLQTDKRSCYVGEPIIATYKLYTRLQSESNLSKNPSFNGFSVIDMMDGNSQSPYNTEKINGREYNTYLIRKAQLYPLQAGSIELEVATLDNKITFVQYENGSANNATTITENVSLSSKPTIIVVKPLPEKNKPADFDGAVGSFNIEAAVEKPNFSTDETGKLLITVSGEGNMQLLTTPEIVWQTGFEAFDTKVTDNVNNRTIPLSGSKIFEMPFAISKEGNYVIPKINFSFFDPKTEMYKSISTKEIPIVVTKGLGVSERVKALETKKPATSFSTSWIVIIAFALVFTFLLFLFTKKKSKGTEKQAIKIEEKEEVKNPIAEAIASNKNWLEKTSLCLHQENCIDFYALLNTELKFYLATRYTLSEGIVDSTILMKEMDKAGVNNNAILQTQQLLQDIEWQLYTPFERNEKLQEMYARAQTIIQLHNMPTA
jgi:BatD DUF11 like domain